MSVLVTNNQTAVQTPGQAVYEYQETVADGVTSEFIMAPDNAGKLRDWSVAVIPAGTARVEYTLSGRDTVAAGGGNWQQWDDGNVTSITSDLLGPVTAVRVVSVTGAATIEVVAV